MAASRGRLAGEPAPGALGWCTTTRARSRGVSERLVGGADDQEGMADAVAARLDRVQADIAERNRQAVAAGPGTTDRATEIGGSAAFVVAQGLNVDPGDPGVRGGRTQERHD